MSKFAYLVAGLVIASCFAFQSRPAAGGDGEGGIEATQPDAITDPGADPQVIPFAGSPSSVGTFTMVCVYTVTGNMDVLFTESTGNHYTYTGMGASAPFVSGHVAGRVTAWYCWWNGTQWVGVRTA